MNDDSFRAQATLAVLIDADNAQPSAISRLLAEIASYGVATVKRIYGDWTTPNLGGWKSVLLEHSIHPIQQFRYTTGKNATDSAMIIDAMDLLYSRRFGGFCLVSSDSDFTRLASRIREEGLKVYGFGEKKTPKAFVSACDKFIYTEVLAAEYGKGATAGRDAPTELRANNAMMQMLRRAQEAASDDTGWAQLGTVGSTIVKQAPEFDPRNYGFRRLGELIIAAGLFEIDERPIGNGQSKAVYIRIKGSEQKPQQPAPRPQARSDGSRRHRPARPAQSAPPATGPG